MTSTECYWKALKLSKVGRINAEYLSLDDLTKKKTNVPEAVNFKDSVLNVQGNCTGVIYNFYKPHVFEKLILKFKAAYPTLLNVESFITFCKNEMISNNINLVEELTRKQSNSSEWYTRCALEESQLQKFTRLLNAKLQMEVW